MDINQSIKERRSVNFFDSKTDVSIDKLKELLEIANLSPSSFNLQPWKVIVVRAPGRKKVLRKCAFNQPKVEEASAVLIIIADPRGVEENIERVFKSWLELGYMKPEMKETYTGMIQNLYGEEDSLNRKLFAFKNASLFAMNVMLAAKGLGLETHPMDGFEEDCVKKEFKISAEKSIPMLIAVGNLKQGITQLPRAFRRSVGEFVSFETD